MSDGVFDPMITLDEVSKLNEWILVRNKPGSVDREN